MAPHFLQTLSLSVTGQTKLSDALGNFPVLLSNAEPMYFIHKTFILSNKYVNILAVKWISFHITAAHVAALSFRMAQTNEDWIFNAVF